MRPRVHFLLLSWKKMRRGGTGSRGSGNRVAKAAMVGQTRKVRLAWKDRYQSGKLGRGGQGTGAGIVDHEEEQGFRG